ncbi:MAG TPA: T9SS type A sorting domain-containing protein, partial [Bacteroidales bacterium]|nr:T9SS type A sorting domain-containing protein [Bacteroidales bacterium]
YKDLVPNILHLGITGNNFRDDTYIQFSPDATAGFDSQGDAYKLWGVQAAPQLYTIIPDDVLSINALPSVNEHPIVPVGLKVGAEGTYVITADGMDSFDPMIPIRLDDLKLGYTQDLRLNNTYSFTASPGDNENRFNIRFYSPVGIEEQPLMNLLVFNENNRISINNAGNYSGMIQVYNSAGQLIESRTMAPGIQKTAMLPPGLYIVKVITGKETDSRKVILF